MNRVIVVNAWPGQPSLGAMRSAAAAGERPRRDYVLLADAAGAEVLDHERLTSGDMSAGTRRAANAGRFLEAQLWEMARRRGPTSVLAWGDNLGLLMSRLPLVVGRNDELHVISHLMSTRRKMQFLRWARPQRRWDRVVFYSSRQRDLAVAGGLPVGQTQVLLQPVDEDFFRPPDREPERHRVCGVGSESRDYPTLLAATSGLDVDVELAVGSSVYFPTGEFEGRVPPTLRPPGFSDDARVTVHHHLPPLKLRDLYGRSSVAVVPLAETDMDAGVTAIVEAMAMGRPVVASATRGQIDVIEHGVTGLLVPPADVGALREAIASLLADPDWARHLGANGRANVLERHRLNDYVDGLRAAIGWNEE